MPSSAFSSQNAAWDFTHVVPLVNVTVPSNGPSTTIEVATNSYTQPQEAYLYQLSGLYPENHTLLLRNANTVSISSGIAANQVLPIAVPTNYTYAVSVSFTKKVDEKYDDGKPYSESFLGTLSATDWSINTSTPYNIYWIWFNRNKHNILC